MRKSYKEIIESFHRLNVLVIGDVMLDEYVYGNVERISPEAPIPVVNVTKKQQRPGGAANVALNLKCLNANVSLCAVVGSDDNGKILENLCVKNNIKTNFIFSKNRPTTVKTRIISQRQHLLRIDVENDEILSDEENESFFKILHGILKSQKFDAVIFEDYDKGVLNKDVISFVIDYCNRNSIITAVDPKFRNFNDYKSCTLFKPNFKEFVKGTNNFNLSKNNIDALIEEVKRFKKMNSIKIILITLSENGMLIVSDKEKHYLPTQVLEVADVSGAGDTVISVATLCLASGMDLYDVAYISNIAAGIVCQKIGVVPIEKEELFKNL